MFTRTLNIYIRWLIASVLIPRQCCIAMLSATFQVIRSKKISRVVFTPRIMFGFEHTNCRGVLAYPRLLCKVELKCRGMKLDAIRQHVHSIARIYSPFSDYSSSGQTQLWIAMGFFINYEHAL